MNFMKLLFGDINAKEVKKLDKIVDKIESLESRYEMMSDDELKNQTSILKGRLSATESLDDILPDAFAVCREAAKRVLGLRAYRVQLMGGIVLHQGRIAEMKTGEGKTLVSVFPAYLNALEGNGVHVITVNDYLAHRDRHWMGKVHEFLGLTVGVVTHGVQGDERQRQYRADITYGTNSEFGFDYLRDNMVLSEGQLIQRGLNYAIVDEVDSILIDEARTPLIISGQGSKSTDLYYIADKFAKTLDREMDVKIDEKAKSIALTDGLVVDKFGEEEEGSRDKNGVLKAEKYFSIENLADPEHMEINHHINQAIRAVFLMKKDVDYIVSGNEIVIIDEFTGRQMHGRRYSGGLHQAIEAKEGIEVRNESQTLATITIQNYFRMYKKLAGMTGTAKTEEDEFRQIYSMDVVQIPTNVPVIRVDEDDAIFKTLKGKYAAVLEDIKNTHAKGQPVLVGTINIEISEMLSKVLKREGLKHEVLNAKHHEREAEVVAQAGRLGSITIATNMAGRGTDIMLGGNPEFLAIRDMQKKGYDEEIISRVTSVLEYDDEETKEAKAVYKDLFEAHKKVTEQEAMKVREAGGLRIVGTERHESRRIDNQLRGRSGRQGDTGSSKFYISFEDDLMRLFISDRAKAMVSAAGMDDEMALENKLLTGFVENAQKKVEGRNFAIRKNVLEFDDVINKQREIIYKQRNTILHGDDVKDKILGMMDTIIEKTVKHSTDGIKYPEDWDIDRITQILNNTFRGLKFENQNIDTLNRDRLASIYKDQAYALYDEKEELLGAERLREIERIILLKIVDMRWIEHIDAMDDLKQGIGLRAIGQQDPVVAFKQEGFDMFEEMISMIQEETIRVLLNLTLENEIKREETVKIISTNKAGDTVSKPERSSDKVGRNDPCPCGSGKKYKKCCGA